ncbi:MAG: long-chain-fatty-acid--CoA ligase [Rhodobacteraceae bacterium]|nr:long-chain-fatty-acid--CoA ligase [Paracoccaceae bacterium]
MIQHMQNFPLRVSEIIDYAALQHPDRKIFGRSIEGPIIETNWRDIQKDAKKFAAALIDLGVIKGDVVGVMAWNTPRQLSVWYGIPGAGAVNHTLNPRLFADQLVYIINHAEDRFLMVDFDLLPIIEDIIDQLTTVEKIIVMTDRSHMPDSKINDLLCYEELIADQPDDFNWITGDENEACGICYTSGTTGDPKGVVYTHRSNTLHALSAVAPDMLDVSSNDRIMPVVPLFHANGWSIAYAAPMVGASMVMPGRDMTPVGLFEMLELGVTFTAAVPTIWMQMLQHLDDNNLRLPTLERVIIGGASCPRSVIDKFQTKYGVQVLHAWGMTEMSPLGTVCSFKPEVMALDHEGRLDVQGTVGHAPFMINLKITDDAGNDLPWDGESQGRLLTKGAAVVQRYHKSDTDAVDADGWFDTGDVATINTNGYVRITDRSKDVIKSGGEWISSIELENCAVGHPLVAEAAAIGIPHPKWDERPILVIVAAGQKPDVAEIMALMVNKFAKWQLPDDIIFMDEIPHTATGKISKLLLRQKLADQGYELPP